ncbi:large neutral amino acids transporter small subunit 2-like, partial [Cyanistes caeruleus]|uniref:large neutral amino acids transporter small subunit 2-like n=1 Tax=Cyanistes caeruleus TaxID=156563 RepID=UPI000CDAECE5
MGGKERVKNGGRKGGDVIGPRPPPSRSRDDDVTHTPPGLIHLRRRTPVPALLLTCASTLLMLVTGDIYTLINYVGFVNYTWYGVTVAGLLVLRRREPELPRPIKVPLVLPALFLLFWAGLLLFSLWAEPVVCGVGVAITATGAPVYWLCLRRGRGQRGTRPLQGMRRRM